MPFIQLAFTAGAILLIGALARFFFGAREATEAQLGASGQEATVVVLGGYAPNIVRARTGVPWAANTSVPRWKRKPGPYRGKSQSWL